LINAIVLGLVLGASPDANAMSPEKTWKTDHRVNSISLTADGSRLLAAGPHGVISLWDTAEGQLVKYLTGSRDDSTSSAISPDGKLAAIGGIEGELQVFDIDQGTVIRSHGEHGSRLERVAFSPDGKYLSSTCWDGRLRSWLASDGTRRSPEKATPIGMGGIAYSPDSTAVWVPAKYADFPGTPKTATEAPIRKISLNEGGKGEFFVGPGTFWTVAVTTDRVAGGTDDGWVMVWDSSKPSVPMKKWQVALKPGIGVGIVSLGWLGNGKHLFAMTMNGEGGIFGDDGTKVASLDRPTDGFVAVGWSADGSRLGIGGWNQTIEVFDLRPLIER
jgi:hypothetical protein